jgi:hypothetical protein
MRQGALASQGFDSPRLHPSLGERSEFERRMPKGTMKFVYLIRSLTVPDQRYVGVTSNLEQRLESHNAGQSPHTSKFCPGSW